MIPPYYIRLLKREQREEEGRGEAKIIERASSAERYDVVNQLFRSTSTDVQARKCDRKRSRYE